ncbi:phospholipase A2-like protein [Herbihabitans rhizosphaerae]|uniref:Phospholipase A2-like protein n=1 Tax=Herbihabitans rhizosphaerae TaxID=1872711 RepID=A0A4Q7KJH2_9PSEU|nr:phospholipase [Herbihabitans rhizosphaerae]RZS34764.1 phospholipase A2-like protein [Herbihabitans rhizosphaerae]
MATSTLRRTIRASVATAAVAGTLFVGAGTASADLTPDQLRSTTDNYLYSKSLSAFQTLRGDKPYANQLDWSSDGCSNSPDNPFGFNLVKACYRHDFGYRNYKKQSRFSEDNRKRIDDNFKKDMYTVCDGNWACNRFADVYYAAVRQFGGGS